MEDKNQENNKVVITRNGTRRLYVAGAYMPTNIDIDVNVHYDDDGDSLPGILFATEQAVHNHFNNSGAGHHSFLVAKVFDEE